MTGWSQFLGALRSAHEVARAFGCSPQEAMRVLDRAINAYNTEETRWPRTTR